MPILERIMVAVGNAALCCALSNVAHAQTTGDQTGSIALGARGGFSADSPTARTQPQDHQENAFGYTMGAGMASDYIYRGVTLSDHQPAVGAVFEARFGNFYGGSTITSVKLPTDPAAELSFSSGIRPSLSGIDFDFGFLFSLPRRGERHRDRLLGICRPRRQKAHGAAAHRGRVWVLAEHFKHRRVEQVRRRRYRRRPSSVKNPARRICLVYHKRRLFLVWQPIAGAGRISLAALRELECRCYFHPRSLPSGPALLQYESFQGELFRFHRRSKRQARGAR